MIISIDIMKCSLWFTFIYINPIFLEVWGHGDTASKILYSSEAVTVDDSF